MKDNFDLLFKRVEDTITKSDLQKIKQQLNSIKGNTIIVGVGGSSVVSEFASKVLKTGGITLCKSSRDLNHESLEMFDNILITSYSGKGYVVENALNKNKKVYLLTNGDIVYDNVEVIKYETSIEKEESFIALAATLMPISILYYYDAPNRPPAFIYNIRQMFNKIKYDIECGNFNIKWNNVYEIMGGNEYSTAMKYLETTMIESGIGIPIIHDKYDYCHGRSTISYKNNNVLIYFDSDTELDKFLLKHLKQYYTEIIKIENKYNYSYNIDNDYYALIKSMYLTKMLAENKEQDLSKVDHSPLVYKLYNYRGEM